MTEPMSYSDAANILEAHNAWRREQNDDTEKPPKWRPEDTRALGIAIDVAVDGLRKLQEENHNLIAKCRALANACVTMDLSIQEITPCKWIPDSEGHWDTECGQKHTFFFDGPKENDMNFCTYCGKKLEEEKNS